MRISDWSADVCSSDLEEMLEKSPAQPDQHDLPQYVGNLVQRPGLGTGIVPHTGEEGRIGVGSRGERAEPPEEHQPADDREAVAGDAEIGSAACRERVGQYG